MSVVSRVALIALVALLSLVGSSVAQTGTYSFCYQLSGLRTETLDDPYSISVNVTGTYNTTELTSTVGKYTPAGQYYTLLTATGLRQIRTRNSKTVTYSITSLLPTNYDFNNNRFYVSNATFPQFVDADGLAFNLSTLALFPGKTYSTYWNVYRQGVYGGVLEDMTSGEDLTVFGFSASINGWTGTQYNGLCPLLPLEFTPIPPTRPVNGTYNVTLVYNLTSEVGEPQWTVNVNSYFYTDGNVYGPDAFGDYYLILNSTGGKVGGTRTYCYSGTCQTSAITAVAPIGTYGFADNRVYSYTPYFDYNGIAYTFSPALPKNGAPFGVNLTNQVNPYVSKGGQFYEGFGSYSAAHPTYGTNPGGYADNTKTYVRDSIVGPLAHP